MLHVSQYSIPYVGTSWENEHVPIALTSQQMTSHLVYCYLTSYLTVVQFRQYLTNNLRTVQYKPHKFLHLSLKILITSQRKPGFTTDREKCSLT